MSDPGPPTADFSGSQEYRLALGGNRHLIIDSQHRVLATLPIGLGGEVTTRTERWRVQTEHHKLSWAVVARSSLDSSELGSIRPNVVPNLYGMRIGADSHYHVTEHPLSCEWTVSQEHRRIVTVGQVAQFASGDGKITTHDSPANPDHLGLAIVLTLEMIKADTVVARAEQASAVRGGFSG